MEANELVGFTGEQAARIGAAVRDYERGKAGNASIEKLPRPRFYLEQGIGKVLADAGSEGDFKDSRYRIQIQAALTADEEGDPEAVWSMADADPERIVVATYLPDLASQGGEGTTGKHSDLTGMPVHYWAAYCQDGVARYFFDVVGGLAIPVLVNVTGATIYPSVYSGRIYTGQYTGGLPPTELTDPGDDNARIVNLYELGGTGRALNWGDRVWHVGMRIGSPTVGGGQVLHVLIDVPCPIEATVTAAASNVNYVDCDLAYGPAATGRVYARWPAGDGPTPNLSVGNTLYVVPVSGGAGSSRIACVALGDILLPKSKPAQYKLLQVDDTTGRLVWDWARAHG